MKRLSLFFILAFAAVSIFAQESTEPGRKVTFVRNGFWDNWFVGAGVGANYYVKGGGSEASFLNKLTVAPTIQVGKWYNPYIGARVKLQGGSLHTYFNSNNTFLHGKYVSAEADLLWNVSNYFGKYNESRFYSLVPYIGVGGGYGWDYKVRGKSVGSKQRNFTINGGILNKFRLTDRLGLDIDLSAALLKEQVDLDHVVTGSYYGVGEKTYDGLVAASASLVFKLGKFGFKEAVLKDQGLIDDLNGQINRLRAENAELSKRPVSCPECPEVKPQPVVEKNVYVPNVVFFRDRKSVV